MAYADKITRLRRMALIRPDSNIVWEGVNIEGICLLKKAGIYDHQILIIPETDIEGFSKEEPEFPLKIKYQDKKTDNYWEPRINKVHKVPKVESLMEGEKQ